MTWYLPANAVIPSLYATVDEYTPRYAGTGAAAPATATLTLILQACTALVYDATDGAWYDADPATGLPTDARLVAALRDATCIQAAAWVVLGVDPLTGGVQTMTRATATTRKIASAVVSHADQEAIEVARAQAAARTGLVPDARRILARVGLLDPSVFAL